MAFSVRLATFTRMVAAALLLGIVALPGPSAAAGVAYVATVTGGSSSSASVPTASAVPAVSGQLYLASVAIRPNVGVQSVSGLGLTWTRLGAQCAGRGYTRVEVWRGSGSPTADGVVTAALTSAATNAVIAVSRYSGADPARPTGSAASANTMGVSGACTGGVDTASYNFGLSTTTPGAMVFAAVATRTRMHTPGSGYTERAELFRGYTGSTAGMAQMDRATASVGTVTVNGTFNGTVDWAVAAVEIRPSGAAAPTNHAPVASNLSVSTPQGTPAGVRLVATDSDGDSLTYRIVDPPDHGSLSGSAPNLTYTPHSGYTGADSFRYVANDGLVDSNIATVSITVTAPPAGGSGLWISAAELASLPMSGKAWDRMKAAADGALGDATVYGYQSHHDVRTLAVALVYARTGQSSYRQKAAAAIRAVIGSENDSGTLAIMVARNLVSYIIAADLIGLHQYDSALDSQFRSWISDLRHIQFADGSLISEHEKRANNHGTMPGASRAAIAVYLKDMTELARTAQVFKGWVGDRSSYAGFAYKEFSWQADPAQPVAINPVGASKQGHAIGGAMPEEMRRGCAFKWPPCQTAYPWGGLQGAVVQAMILSRQGYDVWNWEERALLRAIVFLDYLDRTYDGWWAAGNDSYVPWVINHAYGTNYPASLTRPGHNMGWTDWMYG